MRIITIAVSWIVLLSAQDVLADEIYRVSNGILAVDAKSLQSRNIHIHDESGRSVTGVIPVRSGLAITNAERRATDIGGSVSDLAVFDDNDDRRIDRRDSVWNSMYLAVDYNRNGEIGTGEYALIGDCGVDAILIDLEDDKAWSLHTRGGRREVTLVQW